MDYKYGTLYRSVVRTPLTNACEFLKGAETNPIFNMMMAVIKDSVPEFFHKCPYEVSVISIILISYNIFIYFLGSRRSLQHHYEE